MTGAVATLPRDRSWDELVPPLDREEAPVPDRHVEWATLVIDSTPLPEFFDRHVNKATGRKRWNVTPRGILVGFLLVVTEGRAPTAKNVEAMLYRRIGPAWREEFRTERPTDTPARRRASYKNVLDLLHAMLGEIDPSPYPKNRRLTSAALEASRKPLTDEQLDERRRRLRWVCNELLEASFRMLPRDVRRRWKGSLTVDGTKVPAFAVGRSYDQVWESSDPDADWHVRSHDVHGLEPGQKRPTNSKWAYEATIVAMGYDRPVPVGGSREFPLLALGVELHKPSTTPGLHGVSAIASVHDRGHPTGWVGCDRAYTNSNPETFHLPVRSLGYQLVFDYRVDALGRRAETDGAIMVEGAWYCPHMPDDLVNATIDYRSDGPDAIDFDEWQEKIAARAAYRLAPHETPDAQGYSRWRCPAVGPSATARCSIRKNTPRPKSAKTRVFVPLGTPRPTICRQKTITVAPDAGAKLWQQLHFGSPEWQAVYGSLRNTIEGINGQAKEYEILEHAGRRRIRGIAAQWFLTTFLLVATNYKKITSWLWSADTDESGTVIAFPVKKERAKRRQQDIAAYKATAAAGAVGGPSPP